MSGRNKKKVMQKKSHDKHEFMTNKFCKKIRKYELPEETELRKQSLRQKARNENECESTNT